MIDLLQSGEKPGAKHIAYYTTPAWVKSKDDRVVLLRRSEGREVSERPASPSARALPQTDNDCVPTNAVVSAAGPDFF